MKSIWRESNQGDTTTFWSCGICGASVQTQDKEQHKRWHEILRYSIHMLGGHRAKEL